MPGYDPGWHHNVMADAIHRMISGDLRRLIVSMPPRHGKSELISKRLPAFLLGINPKDTIISASYSGDLSGRINRDVQRVIDNPYYANLFPETRLNTANTRTIAGSWLRNSDIFEVVKHGGIYRSAGVGGGITGLGARWLIIDDPLKNREEADSSTIRNKIYDWYTSTFYTRQAPDARILIVMTRWHADDLVGRLIALSNENSSADKWEVINFPAIATDHQQTKDIRNSGDALWPSMFPIEDLMRIKASIGDYQWAALYQQEPRGGGGTEWPDEYFGPSIWFDEWPSTIQMKTIGVDPSKGRDGKHGDYSAIVKLGRDSDGTLYCEADLQRRNSETIISDVIELQRNFRADVVAVEANQFQELLAVQIVERSRSAGIAIPVSQIINNVAKTTRIRRLGPYLGNKQIRFKANSQGTKLLVEQLKDFPVASHDDGPDSLEMALRVMIELHNGKIRKPARRVVT